jgi:ribosomal protein L39E
VHATKAQRHGRAKGWQEPSLTTVSSHRYNAKRRHWRKTRIGI